MGNLIRGHGELHQRRHAAGRVLQAAERRGCGEREGCQSAGLTDGQGEAGHGARREAGGRGETEGGSCARERSAAGRRGEVRRGVTRRMQRERARAFGLLAGWGDGGANGGRGGQVHVTSWRIWKVRKISFW
jgi:hypothetical protein